MLENRPTHEDEVWVLRVMTDSCRYRLQLSPYDTYQKVIDKIVQKTGYDPATIEVCNNNGKRLNIQPDRKLKDVVYLNHGAILIVRQLDALKNSALKSRASFLSADSKLSAKPSQTPEKKLFSPQKTKCTHPPNGRCLQCLPQEPKKQKEGDQVQSIKKEQKDQAYNQCTHGPNIKCLKCFDKPSKSPQKAKEVQKIVLSPEVKTPKKNAPNNQQITKCKHSSKITCPRCMTTPKKISKITLINPQKSPRSSQQPSILSPNVPTSPKKEIIIQSPKQAKKCDHGPNGKCLHCIIIQKQEKKENKQVCEHSPNAKCLKCLSKDSPKPAHLPFDEYLATRHLNCQHSKENTCPNCLPPKNLRLKIDKKCKKHSPYPKSLCTSCMPENISIKRQEYRHVDYVQFMNQGQIQNFIDFWIREKGKRQMRIGFLYGYYAEDPYYKNGIRAVVEALYEPHQQCTDKLFWITDHPKRKYQLQMIIDSLGLQKIGIVMTTNNPEMPFNDSYIRFLSKMQEENSVTHQTGYRLSNMFTMVIGEKNKDGVRSIQPEIYMVSDQGQALQAAGLFISNKQNPSKMKIITDTPTGQLLPSVYLNGKEVKQFQIEYLLVKIAAGRDKQNKFAILKNNQFPPSSRGSIKGRKVRQYLAKTKKLPKNIRFADLNLLIFICQTLGLETAMEIANRVAQQRQIDEQIWTLVEKELSKYI